MPVVVVTGPVNPACRERLEEEAQVVMCEPRSEAELIAAAREADGLLLWARIEGTEAVFAACPRLRVVGRYGAGFDSVDLDAATRRGIAVVYAPGQNALSVAEYTLMLLLASVKKLLVIDRMTRANDWDPKRYKLATELAGRTLGIVGVGNIGRRVAVLAGAFGMRVLGYDRYLRDEEVRARGAEPRPTLEALLPEVDFLTFHVPLTPETRHMVNDRSLALLRPGAVVVNTSRGPVVDEGALHRALVSGHLAGAALDVWEEEPTARDHPLLRLDNVVCSSHIAGVTREASKRIGLTVANEMLRVLRGELPEALANPDVAARLPGARREVRPR